MRASQEKQRLKINGVSWLIPATEYVSDIASACEGQWRDVTPLRVTPQRRVLKIHGQRPLVVKHFVHGGLLAALKTLMRGTPAGREWKALVTAQERGLETAKPVAVGRCGRILAHDSFVVTEALEEAVSLDNYLWGENRPVGPIRDRVIAKFASLLRKAHDRGLYQRDLHLGNFLVRDGKNGFEVFIIDLQRVAMRSSLSSKTRRKNLAVLQGGCMDATRTDRLRFLKAYLYSPEPLPADLRKLVGQLEHDGWRHRFKLWRSRQKRCVAENREFVKIQAGTFFGFARRDYWNQDLQRLLREPETIFRHSETEVIKSSTTTSVAVVRHSGGRFYVKRYNYQGVGYAIKDLFRSSRARRAWIAANSLHMRGIPVALPVAYLERRRLGILLESYILTEAKSGRNLRLILNDYDKSGSNVKMKRALLDAFARLVRKMHARGVAHRDLKGANLIAQTGPNDTCDLFVVDFDGISLGVVSGKRREKNLARLAEERYRHRCLTRSDRLRFLKVYLATNYEKEWKKVWQAVDRCSR